MDPKERLKRYLEQRKELGERELVLDGMTVEEVMNIVGAAGGGTRRPPRAVRGMAPATADDVLRPADDPEPRVGDPESRPDAATEPSVPDWRDALRASGGAPTQKSGIREPRDSSPPAADPPAAPKPPSKRYEFPRAIDAVSSDQPVAAAPPPLASGSPERAETSASAPHGDSLQPAAVPGVAAPLGIVVGTSSRELFGSSVGKLASLAEIAEVVAGCQRCPLYASATNPVPGEGNPTAELVCVGEAPGANEDATGRPFVGQSGELLTKILAAISLKREDVFICNVLKHRPPGNRNPLPEEVVACSPYLVQQLELIRPKVIVAFGTFAAQTLLNTRLPIGKLRGSVHRYHGVPLIVTYHPAALLRNPAWKRPTWEDVQLARRILDTAPRA